MLKTSFPGTEDPMKKTVSPRAKKICPLVKMPYTGCYCANLTSNSAEAAIYFCGGHFDECDIFSRHSSQQGEFLEPLTMNQIPIATGERSES